MKTITIIFAAITILLLLSILMCGLWIKSKGTDEAGKKFHAKLGIASVVSGLIVSVLAIIAAG